MVQGNAKRSSNQRAGDVKRGNKNSAKFQKQIKRQQQAKKGAPVQLRKDNFHLEALDERDLSKAIAKSCEQKIAAKAIADGGKMVLTDILQKGKELNRELKRSQLKKKVGRVQEKLNELERKAEEKGLV
eukprot:gene1534-1624_t